MFVYFSTVYFYRNDLSVLIHKFQNSAHKMRNVLKYYVFLLTNLFYLQNVCLELVSEVQQRCHVF